MFETLSTYWPHIFVALSIILGVPAAIHVTMTKEEVRAAIGWVGVIVLSPVVGALIYFVGGVNRIRRKTLNISREGLLASGWHHMAEYDVSSEHMQVTYGGALASMQRLGDTVGRCKLTSGNRITLLSTGDEAYAAMLAAIDAAERSILLETYIFDRDQAGERFVQALSAAVARGVAVRVLIDAVGARYSIPSIVSDLQRANVPTDIFNGNIVMGLRLPYANLRTHRKILIVDGGAARRGDRHRRAVGQQPETRRPRDDRAVRPDAETWLPHLAGIGRLQPFQADRHRRRLVLYRLVEHRSALAAAEFRGGYRGGGCGFRRCDRPAHRGRAVARARGEARGPEGAALRAAPHRARHMAWFTVSVTPNERSQTTFRSICALIGR